MDHISLPTEAVASLTPGPVRVIPESLSRECQNAAGTDLSTVNKAVTAAYQIHTSHVACINRDLANEGAALVLVMIAHAGGRA